MKRIVVGIFICLLFANCNKKVENITPKRDSYIISFEDKKLQNYYDSIDKKKQNKTTTSTPKRILRRTSTYH